MRVGYAQSIQTTHTASNDQGYDRVRMPFRIQQVSQIVESFFAMT